MKKVTFNLYDLEDKIKDLTKHLHSNLKKFRLLDPNKYTYKMYEYFTNVKKLEETTNNILNSLLAAQIISQNKDDENLNPYAIIYNNYNYVGLLEDDSLFKLTSSYKNLLEYIICVKSEMIYKMNYSKSTYNSGYIISTEKLDSTINDFYKMVDYLKGKGVKYEVN